MSQIVLLHTVEIPAHIPVLGAGICVQGRLQCVLHQSTLRRCH